METNSHMDIVESCTCHVTMVNNTLSSYSHTAIPELHLEKLSNCLSRDGPVVILVMIGHFRLVRSKGPKILARREGVPP